MSDTLVKMKVTLSKGDFKGVGDLHALKKGKPPNDLVTFYGNAANLFESIPRRDVLLEFAQSLSLPVFSSLISILEFRKSPYFDFDPEDSDIGIWFLTSSLILCRFAEATKETLSPVPFDNRKPIKTWRGYYSVKSKRLRQLERQLRQLYLAQIKRSKLRRTRKKPSVHLDYKRIKNIVRSLDQYFSKEFKKCETKSSGQWLDKLLVERTSLLEMYRAKRRNQILAEIINWRINVDLLAIEPKAVQIDLFTDHDIDMMLSR